MLKSNDLILEKVKPRKIKGANHSLRSCIELDRSLQSSLYSKGQINPLIVLNDYTLISGHRRFAELKRLGAKYIWILRMKKLKRPDVVEYQLAETIHTKDLNPIDKARAFKQLKDSKKASIRQLAKMLNISKTAIEWHLKLLDLPPNTKDDIASGRIKPYGIKMNRLYGKHKLKTDSEFAYNSNDVLYDSLIKRITSMRHLIDEVNLNESRKDKVISLLKDILSKLESRI